MVFSLPHRNRVSQTRGEKFGTKLRKVESIDIGFIRLDEYKVTATEMSIGSRLGRDTYPWVRMRHTWPSYPGSDATAVSRRTVSDVL